jgi:hypothetical protein
MVHSLRPRVPLIALALILCISVGPTAGAQSHYRPHPNSGSGDIPGSSLSAGQAVAIVVGSIAAIAVVVILVVHHKKSQGSADSPSITGCVAAVPSGKTLTDESDKRVYLLAGNAAGVTMGDRVTLTGKPGAATTDFPAVWNTKKIQQDYGACHP